MAMTTRTPPAPPAPAQEESGHRYGAGLMIRGRAWLDAGLFRMVKTAVARVVEGATDATLMAMNAMLETLLVRGSRDRSVTAEPAVAGSREAAVAAPGVVAELTEVSVAADDLARALGEVVAAPLADAPRWAYAELMEGSPRAAFIGAQIVYFNAHDRSSIAMRRLWREADRLVRRYGREWASEIVDLVDDYRFSRGFVELVRMPAGAFLDRSGVLFRGAPIMHLELTGAADRLEDLLAFDEWWRIRSLSLDNCGLDDDDMQRLAASENFGQLRWLSLAYNRIDKRGIEALANSPNFPRLHFVNLAGNRLDPSEHFAHEDGRVVDAWWPEEALSLSLPGGGVPWLDLSGRPSLDLLPDRFRLADAPAPPVVQRQPALAAAAAAA